MVTSKFSVSFELKIRNLVLIERFFEKNSWGERNLKVYKYTR